MKGKKVQNLPLTFGASHVIANFLQLFKVFKEKQTMVFRDKGVLTD